MDTGLSFPPPHLRAIIREPGYEANDDAARVTGGHIIVRLIIIRLRCSTNLRGAIYRSSLIVPKVLSIEGAFMRPSRNDSED